MKYEYRVDVYEERFEIFQNDGVVGMSFGFKTYEEVAAFAEEMVSKHGKIIIVSKWTE